MARKRRFRFGLPTVFAGRPSVGGVGLGCQPIRPGSARQSNLRHQHTVRRHRPGSTVRGGRPYGLSGGPRRGEDGTHSRLFQRATYSMRCQLSAAVFPQRTLTDHLTF